MMPRTLGVTFLLAALTAGCGKNGGEGKGPEAVDGSKYVLAQEPAGARGVGELRKSSKDGDAVVIVGRIGGEKKPFVDGRSSFRLVDLSIAVCPEAEGCPTPWDCCCTSAEEIAKQAAQVRFVDAGGETLRVGAKELLGVKESAVVVVAGKASRDDKGNLTVIASGLYVRK